MWHHHAHTAGPRFQGLDHMRDKGIISFSLRRYTATETTKLIVLGLIMAPLVQTERRVSGHDIKQHQVTIFIEQLRVTNGITPLDFMVVFAMQEHVHFRQRPRGANRFLTEQRIITAVMSGDNFTSALHQ